MSDELTELAAALGAQLRERDLRIATAELCTGGLVAHAITEIAGCSDYYCGSIVAYSNESKVALLNVSEATLALHGAVSSQTALEMARGALRTFGTHVAIGITGIAGPGGGTRDKPVGLVYGALLIPGDTIVFEWRFAGDRSSIKLQTAVEVLRMLSEGAGWR